MYNFRVKAASFVLSNEDVEKALELLDETSGGKIPDEVVVWDKFQWEPIESIMEYIDQIAGMLEEAYEEGQRNPL